MNHFKKYKNYNNYQMNKPYNIKLILIHYYFKIKKLNLKFQSKNNNLINRINLKINQNN